MPRTGPRPKYGNTPTISHGYRFHSKREAARFEELLLLERAGLIHALEWDKPRLRYPLHSLGGATICYYEPDFRYTDSSTGQLVLEDAKGHRTRLYSLKKRWLQAEYGITILET